MQRSCIAFDQHRQIFRSALAQQEMVLRGIFKAKAEAESKRLDAQAKDNLSAQKDALEVVIKNYQIKFEEIICYFEELRQSQAYLDRLNSEIEVLEAQNAFWNKTKQGLRADLKLEQDLALHAASPDTQLSILTNAIREKQGQVTALQDDLETLMRERFVAGPLIEEKLREEIQKQHAAFSYIESFQAEADHDIERLEMDLAHETAELVSVKTDTERTQARLDRKRFRLKDAEAELVKALNMLTQAQAEMTQTVAASTKRVLADHDGRLGKLTHVRRLLNIIGSAAREARTCMEELREASWCPVCRNPYSEATEPYLFWPCGHTTCAHCLARSKQNVLLKECAICQEESKNVGGNKDMFALSQLSGDAPPHVNPLFTPPPGFQHYMLRRHLPLYHPY